MLDYFLIDYIMAVALEELPDVRSEWEQCETFPGKVFELQAEINKIYTPERWAHLEKASLFYKLNRRWDYRTENIAGMQTIYGYMLSRRADR